MDSKKIDQIVESNVELLRSRSAIGIEKYGTTLADSNLPMRDRLNHALLEALDQANYLQWAIQACDQSDVAPADCSGTPASCPDNEGYGCACSPAAAPQVTALGQVHRAKKVGGSYQADGTIVSTFATLAGETRHVFEFDQPAGMLHIFGPGQVEIAASVAAPQVGADERAQPDLTVWYGSMPESNGKSNFTAMLSRKDAQGLDKFDGLTIARSEYPDRVRYEADCVRHLIGELAEKPCILDYDDKVHSGYVELAAPVQAQELEAARKAGWNTGFRDQHEIMAKSEHYRERVFNEILELDSAMGLSRFARTTKSAPAQPVALPDGPSAEDYSDMLRAFFFHYAAGGYNDVGGLVPLETAKDKLEWIVNEDIQRSAPAEQGDTITLTRDELVDHRNQAFEQGVCEGKDQAAQGDALNPAQIEDGYEGGTCIADPTRLGGTVHLHYISPEHAESAFEVIAEIIDAAIAAKAAS